MIPLLMVGVLPSEPPSPLMHSYQMQCLQCHFEFHFAGNYSRHLRRHHGKEPVISVFDERRIDVQELSAALGSKSGRDLTQMIPDSSKRSRDNVQTPEIASTTSGPRFFSKVHGVSVEAFGITVQTLRSLHRSLENLGMANCTIRLSTNLAKYLRFVFSKMSEAGNLTHLHRSRMCMRTS